MAKADTVRIMGEDPIHFLTESKLLAQPVVVEKAGKDKPVPAVSDFYNEVMQLLEGLRSAKSVAEIATSITLAWRKAGLDATTGKAIVRAVTFYSIGHNSVVVLACLYVLDNLTKTDELAVHIRPHLPYAHEHFQRFLKRTSVGSVSGGILKSWDMRGPDMDAVYSLLSAALYLSPIAHPPPLPPSSCEMTTDAINEPVSFAVLSTPSPASLVRLIGPPVPITPPPPPPTARWEPVRYEMQAGPSSPRCRSRSRSRSRSRDGRERRDGERHESRYRSPSPGEHRWEGRSSRRRPIRIPSPPRYPAYE